MPDDDKLLLTVNDAMRLLSLSRSTIHRLISNDELKAVRVGKAVRIPASELQKFVEATTWHETQN